MPLIVNTSFRALPQRRVAEKARHHNSQRGDALIESLIALVLTLTIATGLCYVIARVMSAQRYQITQHAVLSDIARQLSVSGVSGLCSSSSGFTVSISSNLDTVSVDPPTCARVEVSVTPAIASTTLSKTISANQVYTSVSIVTPDSTLLNGGSGLSVRL